MSWKRGDYFRAEGNGGGLYWGVLLNPKTHEAFLVEDGNFCRGDGFSVGTVPVGVEWVGKGTAPPELARLAFEARLV